LGVIVLEKAEHHESSYHTSRGYHPPMAYVFVIVLYLKVLHTDYLFDSNRIAEVCSIETKKKIVADWKDTATAIFEPKYIVSLDDEADKNLEVYDTQGAKVFHFTGVSEVRKSGSFEIRFVQNGEEKVLDLHNYLEFGYRPNSSK
jgi:hypothetical protein